MQMPADSLAAVSVLIVEDEALIAEEIRERLQRFGAQVVDVADTGADALRAAEQLRPDVILMDIRLKGPMTGIETAEAINAKFAAPIVYLTAHADWETVRRAKQSDPFGYVFKPFKEFDLVATIQAALRRHGLLRKLTESEYRFRAIFDQTFQFIGLLTVEGILVEINQTALQFAGIREEDVKGRPFWETPWWAHSIELQQQLRAAIAGAAAGEFVRMEVTHPASDGSLHAVDFSLKPVRDERGKVCMLLPEGRDVTQRKNAEESLTVMLREKEALLKEIHHRVKNNLQIISSLLNLQLPKIKDVEARASFEDSQNRIRAMALIHETLYRSGNFAEIDLTRYVETLCSNLFRSYGVVADRIKLTVNMGPLLLDLDRSISCSLIINELVSNALKYAFPAGRSGTISAEVQLSANDECVLVVADDGVGLPAELDLENLDSLGLNLVSDLAGQLGGKLEITRGNGTAFRIRFPLNAAKGAVRELTSSVISGTAIRGPEGAVLAAR